jgi:hypothetical protein
MDGRIGLGIVCCLALVGCTEAPAPTVTERPDASLAQDFNPAGAGTIRGRVIWEGEAPASEEKLIRAIAYNPALTLNPVRVATTHIPKVNAQNQRVENAVVFLRSVDPHRSRAWDHAAVRVEFQQRQLIVHQGDQAGSVGFVRRGTAIDIVNRDAEYHNLHARGAAIFALPLVEANHVHQRTLPQAGLVDLKCAAGYYWLHAHLFVSDHPYFARTGKDGGFTLEKVPAGTYELVCWLPSWHVVRREIDPETGIIARLAWADPKERTQSVTVQAGRDSEITYRWTAALFAD